MKKLKFMLIAAALSMLTSCGGADNSEPLPTVSAEITGEQLSGVYSFKDGMSEISCEFRDNNTVCYSVTFSKQTQKLEGSYVFDGQTLTLKNADGEQIQCEYNSEKDSFILEGTVLSKEAPAPAADSGLPAAAQ